MLSECHKVLVVNLVILINMFAPTCNRSVSALVIYFVILIGGVSTKHTLFPLVLVVIVSKYFVPVSISTWLFFSLCFPRSQVS